MTHPDPGAGDFVIQPSWRVRRNRLKIDCKPHLTKARRAGRQLGSNGSVASKQTRTRPLQMCRTKTRLWNDDMRRYEDERYRLKPGRGRRLKRTACTYIYPHTQQPPAQRNSALRRPLLAVGVFPAPLDSGLRWRLLERRLWCDTPWGATRTDSHAG